jgi:hypothetical protein
MEEVVVTAPQPLRIAMDEVVMTAPRPLSMAPTDIAVRLPRPKVVLARLDDDVEPASD